MRTIWANTGIELGIGCQAMPRAFGAAKIGNAAGVIVAVAVSRMTGRRSASGHIQNTAPYRVLKIHGHAQAA